MRQLGRAAIDLKADLFLLQNKSDDAAALGESWNVAYRERTKALGRSQNGRELVFLRRTDKQNAAGRRILHFLDPPYRQLPPIDALAFHGRVQNRPKRILSENAYEQVGADNSIRLPSDKLSEVVEIGGFYLRLSRMWLLCKGRTVAEGCEEKRGPEQREGSRNYSRFEILGADATSGFSSHLRSSRSHRVHVICPYAPLLIRISGPGSTPPNSAWCGCSRFLPTAESLNCRLACQSKRTSAVEYEGTVSAGRAPT